MKYILCISYIFFTDLISYFIHFRREDSIDTEVKASGFVRQIEKETDAFFQEIEIRDKEEEEEDDDNETIEDNEDYEDCVDNIEDLECQLNDLQLQNEIIVNKDYNASTKDKSLNNDNEHLNRISTMPDSDKQSDTENECERNNEDVTVMNVMTDEKHKDSALYDSSLNTDNEVVHFIFDDSRSIRSVSTAATIAPDVIKKRTKLALDKRERSQAKRAVVKGEASAVTRIRRNNRATIKESTGIWGWE